MKGDPSFFDAYMRVQHDILLKKWLLISELMMSTVSTCILAFITLQLLKCLQTKTKVKEMLKICCTSVSENIRKSQKLKDSVKIKTNMQIDFIQYLQ